MAGEWEHSDYTQSGGSTKCEVRLYYRQNDDGTSFYIKWDGYAAAAYDPGRGSTYFSGNSIGYVALNVDGEETSKYTYITAKSSSVRAANSGWVYEPESAGTSRTITRPAKNTPYVCTIKYSGAMSKTNTKNVTYTFTLPIFVNPDGTVKAVEKAYANVNGEVVECAVYVNVGGEIKQLT